MSAMSRKVAYGAERVKCGNRVFQSSANNKDPDLSPQNVASDQEFCYLVKDYVFIIHMNNHEVIYNRLNFIIVDCS